MREKHSGTLSVHYLFFPINKTLKSVSKVETKEHLGYNASPLRVGRLALSQNINITHINDNSGF